MSTRECPFQETLEILGRRHALAVLRHLTLRSPLRFNELQDSMRISPKTLSARLSELVESGLVERKAYVEIPPRVEYTLTERGRGLTPIFAVLEDWQVATTSAPAAAAMAAPNAWRAQVG